MASNQFAYQEAVNELTKRLGNRTDLGTRRDDWLWSAMLTLAKSEIECPFLEVESQLVVLATGQASYTVESLGLQDIIGIRLWRNTTDNQRMRKFPFADYRALSTQASGDPIRWTRRGNTLFVDPLPNERKETLLDYRRQPQRETFEFDNEWFEPIVNMAVVLGWRALDEPQKASNVFQQLPGVVQVRLQQPLSQDEWEAMWGVGPYIVLSQDHG